MAQRFLSKQKIKDEEKTTEKINNMKTTIKYP